MAETSDTSDSRLQSWITSETLFMRYQGGALILIGLLSLVWGFFENTNGETAITVFNIFIAIALGVAGLWVIWTSYKPARMQRLVEEFLTQPANRQLVLAGMQIVIGILFVLEGLRGRIALLVFGILLFTIAGWAFRRSSTVRQFQE